MTERVEHFAVVVVVVRITCFLLEWRRILICLWLWWQERVGSGCDMCDGKG